MIRLVNFCLFFGPQPTELKAYFSFYAVNKVLGPPFVPLEMELHQPYTRQMP